jgi:hypothetical protein
VLKRMSYFFTQLTFMRVVVILARVLARFEVPRRSLSDTLGRSRGKGVPEWALAAAILFQLMVMVTGAEWLSEPDVPVTISVT